MMIDSPRVSTIDKPERYGGLLICGLNYGLPKGETAKDEALFQPWAEYFSHPSNLSGDRFVGRIATWFSWWNIPLEIGTIPTELNHSISQTNLYYDSSRAFSAPRAAEEVDLAFKRLSATIARLRISGILLASIQMLEVAQSKLGITTNWALCRSGQFTFRHALSGTLRVAVCPHPSYPVSKKDVAGAKDCVKSWIEDVMDDYKRKQAEQSVGRRIIPGDRPSPLPKPFP